MGIASCFVGSVMLLIQMAVIAAAVAGVQDNQGTLYAFFVPFFTYVAGIPIGLLLALIGFIQRSQKHTAAVLGLLLTLAGPIVFLVSIAVL
jgi:hypothetical protein